jgi:CheY-like chemotaxis protein
MTIDPSDRRAVEQAREDFCAAMRHEIRTPLNGVLGMLNVLIGGDLRPGQRDQALAALASARALADILSIHCECPDDAGSPQRTPAGLNVLVVDDSQTNRMVVEAMLGVHGCTIHHARDGLEAVRLVRQGGRFDIVLMDIQMPVMDGVTATRHIRALPGPAAGVPIIALTANVAPEQRATYFAVGMDGFVAKPIELKCLLRAIVEATERGAFLQPQRISV